MENIIDFIFHLRKQTQSFFRLLLVLTNTIFAWFLKRQINTRSPLSRFEVYLIIVVVFIVKVVLYLVTVVV